MKKLFLLSIYLIFLLFAFMGGAYLTFIYYNRPPPILPEGYQKKIEELEQEIIQEVEDKKEAVGRATTTIKVSVYPDRKKTPGGYRATTKDELCSTSTKEFRNVSDGIKKKVYQSYGVPYPQPRGTYELDHFLPLSLGGGNDTNNLWPQAKEVDHAGFREKDRLEFWLYKQVCANKIKLHDAQQLILIDWYEAYQENIVNKFGSFEFEGFEECEEGCP